MIALYQYPCCLNHNIDGVVLDCSYSIAYAMELLHSCTKPFHFRKLQTENVVMLPFLSELNVLTCHSPCSIHNIMLIEFGELFLYQTQYVLINSNVDIGLCIRCVNTRRNVWAGFLLTTLFTYFNRFANPTRMVHSGSCKLMRVNEVYTLNYVMDFSSTFVIGI